MERADASPSPLGWAPGQLRSWAIGARPDRIDRDFWRSRDVELIDARLDDYVSVLAETVRAIRHGRPHERALQGPRRVRGPGPRCASLLRPRPGAGDRDREPDGLAADDPLRGERGREELSAARRRRPRAAPDRAPTGERRGAPEAAVVLFGSWATDPVRGLIEAVADSLEGGLLEGEAARNGPGWGVGRSRLPAVPSTATSTSSSTSSRSTSSTTQTPSTTALPRSWLRRFAPKACGRTSSSRSATTRSQSSIDSPASSPDCSQTRSVSSTSTSRPAVMRSSSRRDATRLSRGSRSFRSRRAWWLRCSTRSRPAGSRSARQVSGWRRPPVTCPVSRRPTSSSSWSGSGRPRSRRAPACFASKHCGDWAGLGASWRRISTTRCQALLRRNRRLRRGSSDTSSRRRERRSRMPRPISPSTRASRRRVSNRFSRRLQRHASSARPPLPAARPGTRSSTTCSRSLCSAGSVATSPSDGSRRSGRPPRSGNGGSSPSPQLRSPCSPRWWG